MEFWKEHPVLRIVLIAVLFVLAMVLVVKGWQMTGQLAGLGVMVLGVALLLAALYIYNRPFQSTPDWIFLILTMFLRCLFQEALIRFLISKRFLR